MKRLWELALYAIDNAWRSRLRTLLTVAGIAIASGALVSMVGFILGLREQIETPIRQLGLFNNIEVSRHEDPDEGAESPILDDAMLSQFESIPGVDYAYPDLRLSEVKLQRGEFESECFAIGIAREAGLTGFTNELIESGEFFSLSDANEIILAKKLATDLGFQDSASAIGGKLFLTAGGLVAKSDNEFERQQQQMELTIVGIFVAPGFASSMGESTALLPVDLMRHMPSSWMESGLNRLRSSDASAVRGYAKVIVRAKNPGDVISIEKRLEEMGFATLSVMTRMEGMKQFFLFMEILLSAVGTVALVVAGLGILNTLTMTVMERYQEIGIYKSIGASHGDIRWLFLIEAGAVGLLGGLAGLILARVVSLILAWVFNTYAFQNDAEGPEAVFLFPGWLLAGAVGYSVLISIVSGLYPASKAANIDPIQALRRG